MNKLNLSEDNPRTAPQGAYLVVPANQLRAQRPANNRGLRQYQRLLEADYATDYNSFAVVIYQMMYYFTQVWDGLADGSIPWREYVPAADLVVRRLERARVLVLSMYSMVTGNTYNPRADGYDYVKRIYNARHPLPRTYVEWNYIRQRSQEQMDMNSILQTDAHYVAQVPFLQSPDPLDRLVDYSTALEALTTQLEYLIGEIVRVRAKRGVILEHLFFSDPVNNSDPLYSIDQLIDVAGDVRNYMQEGVQQQRQAAPPLPPPPPPAQVRRQRDDDDETEDDDDDPFAVPPAMAAQLQRDTQRILRDDAVNTNTMWMDVFEEHARQANNRGDPGLNLAAALRQQQPKQDDDMEWMMRPMG